MRRILALALVGCIPEPERNPWDPADDWDSDSFTEDDGDCDDADPSAHPAAVEVCDDVDHDCDGAADDVDGVEVCSMSGDEDCDGTEAACRIAGVLRLDAGFPHGVDAFGSETWPVAAAGDVYPHDEVPGTVEVVTGSASGHELRLVHYVVEGGQVVGVEDARIGTGGNSQHARASAAGDLDGDGSADLVGSGYAPWRTGEGHGSVYLVFGPIDADHDGPISDAVVILNGQLGDSAGAAVAGAGDLDGDGDAEVLVGAPGYGGGVGSVWLVEGDPSLPDTPDGNLWVQTSAILEGDERDVGLGASVGPIGDVDGDGLADFAVGTYGDGGETTGMAVYVVRGKATGHSDIRPIASVATAKYGTNRDGAGAGYPAALTRIGDLDGDGLDDLAVGTVGDDVHNGSAWIVLAPDTDGEDLALSDQAFVEIVGGDASFGASISSGDLDADGVPDLVVGAPYEAARVTGGGAAYVFVGWDLQAGGERFDRQHAFAVIEGATDYGRAGDSLTVPGDLTGDGFDDLVVGERLGDDGTIWLFPGGPR